MKTFSEYQGGFLNHLEGVYRPDDRELAKELAEALGLFVREVRFTETSNPLLSVHPNGEDLDPTNNVILLYEMAPDDVALVALLQEKLATDAELSSALAARRERVRTRPASMPHFGLRYRSTEAIERVLDRLRAGLSADLARRVAVEEMPAYRPIAGLPDIRQVFVSSDVFAIGSLGLDQVIELQVERAS